jgi:hypothetical protein
MLGVVLHAPRGLFYSPKVARTVGTPVGRQFLPSIGWRTRQSGALPDMNNARFLSWQSRPLSLWSTWDTGHCSVHTEQSGATK